MQPASVTLTAAARSAPGSTRAADLPPSSSATRLMSPPAMAAMWRPARVEPVNDTMSTSGCRTSASPTSGPVPCTRLNTPAGRSACRIASARRKALVGPSSDGLSTTVQPASSAGATLPVIWCSG